MIIIYVFQESGVLEWQCFLKRAQVKGNKNSGTSFVGIVHGSDVHVPISGISELLEDYR